MFNHKIIKKWWQLVCQVLQNCQIMIIILLTSDFDLTHFRIFYSEREHICRWVISEMTETPRYCGTEMVDIAVSAAIIACYWGKVGHNLTSLRYTRLYARHVAKENHIVLSMRNLVSIILLLFATEKDFINNYYYQLNER